MSVLEEIHPIVPLTDVFARFPPTDVLHKNVRHHLEKYPKYNMDHNIQYHGVFQRNFKYLVKSGQNF